MADNQYRSGDNQRDGVKEAQFYMSPLWSAKTKERDATLQLTIFNRRLQWTVWGPNGGKPLLSCPMGGAATEFLIRILNDLLDCKGPYKEPFKQVKWNGDTKQWEVIAQLLFIRDERGAITAEATGSGFQKMVFEIKAPGGFNGGGDGLSMTDRGNFEVSSLLSILEQSPTILAISTFNQPPQRGGSGGNPRNGRGAESSRGSGDDPVF